MSRIRLLIFALAWLVAGVAWGANVCVRQGGTGDGSTWDNALANIPTPPVRGNTYWLADGSYSGFDITSSSSTTVITVRKATADEHGTDTGWSSSYGDGVALFDFQSIAIQNAGYVTIDGSSPAVSQGIKFTYNRERPDEYGCIPVWNYSLPANHVTLKSIWFQGTDAEGVAIDYHGFFGVNGASAVKFYDSGKSFHEYWWLSNCVVMGFGTPLMMPTTKYMLIENCELAWNDNANAAEQHPNLVYASRYTDSTFRYNYVHDTRWLGWGSDPFDTSGTYIYGNLFVNNDNGDAIHMYWSSAGYTHSDVRIYNNTFVNFGAVMYSQEIPNMSGYAWNNIVYNCGDCNWGSLTAATNWYNNGLNVGEAGRINGSGIDPFVWAATNNYHIVASTNAGYPRNRGADLGETYNTDKDGVTRGADGAWDLGAYEFSTSGGGGASTNAELEVSANITLPVGVNEQSTTNTFTVQNVGVTGTLNLTNYFSGDATDFSLSALSYSLEAGQSTNVAVIYAHGVGASTNTATIVFEDIDAATNITRTAEATTYKVYEIGERADGVAAYLTDNPSNSLKGWQTSGTIIYSIDDQNETPSSTNAAGVATYWITNGVVQDLKVEMSTFASSTSFNSLFWTLGTWPTNATAVNQYCTYDVMTNGYSNLTAFACWRGTNTVTNALPDEAQFNPVVLSNMATGLYQLKLLTREPSIQIQWVSVESAGTTGGETNEAPTWTRQPQDSSGTIGEMITLWAVAEGIPAPEYQWYKDGGVIAGATTTTINIDTELPNPDGAYHCVASNSVGTNMSRVATVTVGIPVTIATQPVGATNAVGTSWGTTVEAEGSLPLAYQWTSNGTAIAGQTYKGFTLSSLATNFSANYAVIVTNAYGTNTSSNAVLVVGEVPYFVTNIIPTSITTNWSSNFVFYVTAGGYAPLGYQWRHNGYDIGEWATFTNYLQMAIASRAGTYDCVVTNLLGSITSSAATLEVIMPNLPLAPVPWLRLITQ